MKIKSLRNYITYAVTIAILSACGGNTNKENNNSEEFEKAQADLKQNVKKVLYEIPSPAEIPFLLQATGADFDASLINPIDKVDVDHILPWSFLYSDDLWNLVYSHRSCNSSKSNIIHN